MGERYVVCESSVWEGYWNVYDAQPHSWREYIATTDSEVVAQRISRALNLLDAAERQADAPHNPEDDGA